MVDRATITSPAGMDHVIESILESFDHSPIVALGERHSAREDSDFRIGMVQHPLFSRIVNDVVIEFGNALYQPVLDAYIAGDSVPIEQIRQCWQSTTQPGSWDSPVYAEFLASVRAMNQFLDPSARIRVLAGDPPLDWQQIHRGSDFMRYSNARDEHAAEVIDREVIRRGRRALVLYGSAHLYRNFTENLVSLLECRAFVVVPVSGPEAALGDSFPALLPTTDPSLGKRNAAEILERGTKRIRIVDGQRIVVPVFDQPVPLDQMVDACLYFGPYHPTFVDPETDLYHQTDYGRELNRRRSILFTAG